MYVHLDHLLRREPYHIDYLPYCLCPIARLADLDVISVGDVALASGRF